LITSKGGATISRGVNVLEGREVIAVKTQKFEKGGGA